MGLLNRILRRDPKSADVPNKQVRRFDAAAGGRRWDSHPTMGNIGAETLWAGMRVRERARYFVANNPYAAAGVNALATAIVGAGIVAASKHPDAAIRQAIGAAVDRWAPQADIDGLTDLYGLQAAAVLAMIVDGEAFMHFVTTAEGLRVRLLPAEMVDQHHTIDLGGGARVIGGIEFDQAGRRVAFWISPVRPEDFTISYLPPVRVPASEILHLYRPLGAGQVRGISWLAPVLLRLNELDQLEDALLVGAKVAAMHAGFLVDQNGTAGEPYDGQQIGSILESGLEPGTLKFVPGGYDVKFSTPQQAAQGVEFGKRQLYAISAGLGVPYHLLTGDLSGANYSSLRAGTVAFNSRCEQIQFQTVIPQMVRPTFNRAISTLVLSGALDAPDFERNVADYYAADFYPPAQPWVDPLKDQEAEALAVQQGFKSRRQVVAAQGFSVESLDVEIAADRAREKALGLTFPTAAVVTSVPKQEFPDA